jgi:type IV pilus assembly protein PilQ
MITTRWARASYYLIAVILPAFLCAQETHAPPAGGAAQQVGGAAAPVGGEKAISLTPGHGELVKEAPPTAEGRVTFHLKDADIHDILHTFSLRYGVVIVADPGVKGKVTVSLTDVPWETALKQIVESCGYSCVKEGKVCRVTSRPPPGAGIAGISAEGIGAATPLPQGAVTPVPQPSAETGAGRAPASGPLPVASPGAAAPPIPSAGGTGGEEVKGTPSAAAVAEHAPPAQATPAGGALPQTPPPGAAPPAATPTAAVGVEPTTGKPAEGQVSAEKFPSAPGRVTFDFKDADIVNILRIFSTRYGINIVAGPEVQGKVTIRLVDVPWETALKLILESNNYSYVKQNNVVRVISRDQLDKEPLETQVFPLSYARATEMINSVTHLLTPARGQIKPDDRSNTLVVTDTPGKLTQIEAIISRLDRRTPQVLIESRILELKDDFDENIGINWVSLKGYNVTFGPPKDQGMFSIKREEVYGHEDSHADIFSDLTTKTDTKDSTAGKSDTSTTTISTSGGASGTDITHANSASSASEYLNERIRESGRTGIQNLANPIGGSLGSQDTAIQQRGNRVMTTDLRQAVLTPDNFQLTLNFLQEQTDANLISHPKLVTADNKESTIKVTEQWPLPKFSLNSQTGQYDITDFEYKDIGIILKVKPHVNEDDFINMSVTPEVSDIVGQVTFGGAIGAQLPLIQTRTATTDVLIKNGQTLAIGGLMREDETDNVSKVPLFGEIPIIGPYIFTNSSKVIFNRNLIIFITANVVTEENKDNLWLGQREDEARRLNLPRTKWWEPKKLRHGLGSTPGY